MARRLRIAFIGARGVGNSYSGIETYYEEVGSRLADRGHSVTVYCRSYFTPPMRHYRGMTVRRLPAMRSKHFETASHSLLATFDGLLRRYDVIQYHAIGSAPLAVLPRLLGTKTIVSVRGLDWQRAKWGGVARAYLRLGEWASARCPNATAVVSKELSKYYKEHYHLDAYCIPNALPDIPTTSDGVMREFGLTPRRYLLYAGRLSPEKGLRDLTAAFAKVPTHDFKLVLAGGGSYAERFVASLQQSAPPGTRFLGPVDHARVHSLLKYCYAFVLPSYMEGLSLSLLEAVAHGACIITTDIPENVEVVGRDALLFRPGDVSGLASALRCVIEEPELAEEYRRRTRRRRAAMPTWDDVARDTEALFYRLTDRE